MVTSGEREGGRGNIGVGKGKVIMGLYEIMFRFKESFIQLKKKKKKPCKTAWPVLACVSSLRECSQILYPEGLLPMGLGCAE